MMSPRLPGRVGEQMVVLILASQVAATWLPAGSTSPDGPFGAGGLAPETSAAPPPVQDLPVRAAYERPASYTRVAQRRSALAAPHVASAVAVRGIPTPALAAYRRGAAVLGVADPACRLDWQLLAAIGRVESDHGRYGGATLRRDGVSRPGIYGLRLDGTHGTRAITDTDAGQFDNDNVYDRAVGPMQFIPSTWSVVGVDADGDGTRDPQDIDDAALAAAVYLCSGPDDLGTDAGRRAAVHRYNHSDEYVELVLAIRLAYVAGDWTAVRPIAVALPTPDPVEPGPVTDTTPAGHAEPVPVVHAAPADEDDVDGDTPVSPGQPDATPPDPGNGNTPTPPDAQPCQGSEPVPETEPTPETEPVPDSEPAPDPEPAPEPSPVPQSDTEPALDTEATPDTEPCPPPADDPATCEPTDQAPTDQAPTDQAPTDQAPTDQAPTTDPLEPCDPEPLPHEAPQVPVGVPVRPVP